MFCSSGYLNNSHNNTSFSLKKIHGSDEEKDLEKTKSEAERYSLVFNRHIKIDEKDVHLLKKKKIDEIKFEDLSVGREAFQILANNNFFFSNYLRSFTMLNVHVKKEIKKFDFYTTVFSNLKNNPHLEELIICNEGYEEGHEEKRGIDDDITVNLATCLTEFKKLKLLKLRHNFIGDLGAKTLGCYLKNCPSLNELDLEWNQITEESAKQLAENCKNINYLNLSSNFIGKGVVDFVKNCSYLEVVVLDAVYISDKQTVKIADEETVKLSEFIGNLKNLRVVFLCYNDDISDDGAEALAKNLSKCIFLEELYLDSNNIGDRGAVSLAENLSKCKHFQHISLNNNKIGDEGAKALAKFFKDHIILNYLNISRNPIDIDGARALTELCTLPNLEHLTISNNKSNQKKIVDLLKNHFHLNIFDDKEVDIIQRERKAELEELKKFINYSGQ